MAKQAGRQSLKANTTLKNEPLFFELLAIAGMPKPEKEVKMIDKRRYRIDYAWPAIKLGIEIQGGVFTRGAHGSIYGILAGYKKANDACEHGWSIMYYLPSEMLTTETINQIKRAYQWKLANGSMLT